MTFARLPQVNVNNRSQYWSNGIGIQPHLGTQRYIVFGSDSSVLVPITICSDNILLSPHSGGGGMDNDTVLNPHE